MPIGVRIQPTARTCCTDTAPTHEIVLLDRESAANPEHIPLVGFIPDGQLRKKIGQGVRVHQSILVTPDQIFVRCSKYDLGITRTVGGVASIKCYRNGILTWYARELRLTPEAREEVWMTAMQPGGRRGHTWTPVGLLA